MPDWINLAKELFNETWDLIDKPDRTREEDALMLHKAHASCLLWRRANSPVNDARGEWQVSRVYSLLGMGEPALLHGAYSLKLCLENGIGGFDLAFGYEAVARAQKLLGLAGESAQNKALGLSACTAIAEKDDRDYALSNFEDI